jgi:probable HAF family extracellular repeat protein
MSGTGYSHGAIWDLSSGAVSEMGVLGFIYGDLTSVGRGINDTGEVVGDGAPYWTSYSFPFYRLPSDGLLRSLEDQSGLYRYATGINASGQMVGYGPIPPGPNFNPYVVSTPPWERAILWPAGSYVGSPYTITDAPTVNLGDPPGGFYSHANAINDAGQIVGFANTANGEHAMLWNATGSPVVDLGVLAGGTSSRANGINQLGDVVGFSTIAGGARHAFLLRAQHMQDLGTLPGGHESVALGVNDAGHVVGWSDNASYEAHAVFWANGAVLDLGQTGATSQANAIDQNDRVVGYSDGLGRPHHAVLWAVSPPDPAPPTIAVTPTSACLWPANHTMECFELGVDIKSIVTDVCDPNPIVRVTSVTSSQPQSAHGANAGPDVSWTDTGFCVRRDRTANLGPRTYTVVIRASDHAGNATTKDFTIVVPLDASTGCR